MWSPITPLLFAAALSVFAYCSIGIAGITGLFPLADPAVNPFGDERAPTYAVQPSGPISRPVTARSITPAPLAGTRPMKFQHGKPVTAPNHACLACGSVLTITKTEASAHKPATASAGALGIPLFGIAQAAPDDVQFAEKTITYATTVRMEDGSIQSQLSATHPNVLPGQRVRIGDGTSLVVQ